MKLQKMPQCLETVQYLSTCTQLKGYSGISLIHGLTITVTPSKIPPKRSSFLTASLRSFSNLRNDRVITIHSSPCLQQETTIKKPQIMFRTAPNFSNSTNRVPAHSSRHQTSASLAGFLLKREHSSPLSCSSVLAVGKPDESITECC